MLTLLKAALNRPRVLLWTLAVALLCAVPGDARAEQINWVNVPIGEFVIPRYEAISGKRLMVDGTVAGSTITINSQIDMSNAEAVEFIKGSLLLNGFAIVGKDEKTDVLINAAGKSPMGIKLDPTIYIEGGKDLPAGDQLITYVMKLQFVAPEDALRVFQTVARPSPYSTIAPVANVNAIVITDNVPLVRALIQLKNEIDVPGVGVSPVSLPLIRADAQEVATAINEILQSQSSGRSGSSGARPNVVISPQGRTAATPAAGAAAVAAPDGNSIQIQAITRTNSILVIARPVDTAYIRSLVEIFDAPSDVDNFLKRELKYIPVTDFLPVAQDALSRYVDQGGGGAAGGRNTNTRTTGLNGNNNRNNNNTNNRNGNTGTTGGFSGGGGLSNPEALSGPESLLVGNTLIIGDSQLNNVVVSGPPEHLRIIDQLLDEIDIRPRQVYISAVIAQVSLGDEIRKGYDLLRTVEEVQVGDNLVNIAGSFRNTIGGSTVINVDDLLTVSDAFPRPDGLGVWAEIGDFFNAYIQALEQTNKFQVISRPFVFTANNQLASIASGERVAVPTQTVSSLDAAGNVSSSIGFEEVLLRLDVIPLINSKDEVTLTITQENENITGTTTIGGNEVPDIATQQFETTVRLPNKAIVVLGGIIQEDDNENVNGLPLLARVPGLKHVMGSTLRQKNRRELLIFIQPHIIESTEDLVEKNIHEVRKTIVADAAIDAARAEPEMDSALFPMGQKKKLFGRRGSDQQETFTEPPLPEWEASGPAPQPSDQPKRGLLKKIFDKNGSSTGAPPKPAKKKKGLFGRRKA